MSYDATNIDVLFVAWLVQNFLSNHKEGNRTME